MTVTSTIPSPNILTQTVKSSQQAVQQNTTLLHKADNDGDSDDRAGKLADTDHDSSGSLFKVNLKV